MKKTVRTIFGAVACLALLGTAVSCNHDIDADDPFVTPSNNNQNENGNGDNENATELLTETFDLQRWDATKTFDKENFATAKAGDKLIFTYEHYDSDDADHYGICQFWSGAISDERKAEHMFAEVSDCSTTGTKSVVLKEADAAALKEEGLTIQGHELKISSMKFVSIGGASASEQEPTEDPAAEPADEPAEAPADIPAADTTVWTGSTDLAWGARAPEVALADKEFTGLKITYTTTADAGLCFKLLDTSWGAFELTSVTGDGSLRAADASDDPLKAVDLTSGKTDGVVTVTFADVTAVKAGLGFQGAPGVTITKIELVTE